MIKKYWLGIALILLLAGCSSKFAYNNLDWLAYWYLDDYIDLTHVQKKQVDQKLQGWLSWHRTEELVHYRQQLVMLREQHLKGALSAEQWLAYFEQGSQDWQRFRDKLAPDVVELSPMLSEQQINQLFDELEKENRQQQQDRADKTEHELLAERLDDINDNITEFTGRLSAAQKHLIKRALPDFKATFSDWLVYRRAWQQAARTMLIKRHETADFATSFLHLITHPQQFQDQQFITLVEQNRMVYARLVADIDQSLTTKQRAKMARELTDLIEDLDDLIGSD